MSVNLTLAANIIAVFMAGAAVALAYGLWDIPNFSKPIVSVALAYTAGIITATASRYHVVVPIPGVREEEVYTPLETPNERP